MSAPKRAEFADDGVEQRKRQRVDSPSAVLSEEDVPGDEEDVPGDAVCDIQCFYCERILRAADSFVLCEQCEGFVSCVACWSKTEQPGERYTLKELKRQQIKLATEDLERENELWPRLLEHSFRMQHADWTNPEKHQFNTYTFQKLHKLRCLEAAWIAAGKPVSSDGLAEPQLAQKLSVRRKTLVQSAINRHSPESHALFLASQPSTNTGVSKSAPSDKCKLGPNTHPFGAAKPTIRSAVTLVLAAPAAAAAAASSSGPQRSRSHQTTLVPTTCAPVDLTKPYSLAVKPQDTYLRPRKEMLQLFVKHPTPLAASHLEVRASHYIEQKLDEPCELGVFAKQPLQKGDQLCHYAAHFSHVTDMDIVHTHARRLTNTDNIMNGLPTAKLFNRFIPHSLEGIEMVKRIPAAEFMPPKDSRQARQLAELPIGCMINSPGAGEANVTITHITTNDSDGLQLGTFTMLVARCDIKVGVELLCPYGNKEEKAWM